MIDSYKYVNGKIVAYDSTNGLKEYDYQDNIHEILEQENVVEELNDIIARLHNQVNYSKKPNPDFYNMIFDSKYGEKLLIPFMVAFLSVVGMVMSHEFLTSQLVIDIFANIGLLSLVSMIPMGINYQKKYKKDKSIRIFNLEQQITEFEEKLNIEQEKLDTLRHTKTSNEYEKNNTNEVIFINNEKIDELSKIRRKKILYEFYREYLGKIQKYNNQEYLKDLYDTDFTDDDIKFVNQLEETNKARVKRK